MEAFHEWLQNPFSADMSVAKWVAWVGLLMAAIALWGLIIHRITED